MIGLLVQMRKTEMGEFPGLGKHSSAGIDGDGDDDDDWNRKGREDGDGDEGKKSGDRFRDQHNKEGRSRKRNCFVLPLLPSSRSSPAHFGTTEEADSATSPRAAGRSPSHVPSLVCPLSPKGAARQVSLAA